MFPGHSLTLFQTIDAAIAGAAERPRLCSARPTVHDYVEARSSVCVGKTTDSSWLIQGELWFAKIERDVTARGLFTSVTDLRRKRTRYIKHYNKTATPIRWSYADPPRRTA